MTPHKPRRPRWRIETDHGNGHSANFCATSGRPTTFTTKAAALTELQRHRRLLVAAARAGYIATADGTFYVTNGRTRTRVRFTHQPEEPSR